MQLQFWYDLFMQHVQITLYCYSKVFFNNFIKECPQNKTWREPNLNCFFLLCSPRVTVWGSVTNYILQLCVLTDPFISKYASSVQAIFPLQAPLDQIWATIIKTKSSRLGLSVSFNSNVNFILYRYNSICILRISHIV